MLTTIQKVIPTKGKTPNLFFRLTTPHPNLEQRGLFVVVLKDHINFSSPTMGTLMLAEDLFQLNEVKEGCRKMNT